VAPSAVSLDSDAVRLLSEIVTEAVPAAPKVFRPVKSTVSRSALPWITKLSTLSVEIVNELSDSLEVT